MSIFKKGDGVCLGDIIMKMLDSRQYNAREIDMMARLHKAAIEAESLRDLA